MSYYNLIFHRGVNKFCQEAIQNGAQGLIVPDMPPDEEKMEGYFSACAGAGLFSIPVVSPVSTTERLLKIKRVAKGFVYCTARLGTTGAKERLPDFLFDYLNKVKEVIGLPRAVGFGISRKDHIESLRNNAEIAVIGSALIDCYRNAKDDDKIREIQKFIRELKEVL